MLPSVLSSTNSASSSIPESLYSVMKQVDMTMEQDSKIQNSNRAKGRGRGRGKKKVVDSENKEREPAAVDDDRPVEPEIVTLDLDADITQLEAPTFSTLNKGPPEPMLRLSWNHKTHLIGEKVINPMIHCCDKCDAPILTYGRMIPCKHVFCLACAKSYEKVCPRCQDKVLRIEKTGLGTVFMCTFGGTRYGNTGCRRTYLSQRDLQAHINHRHVSESEVEQSLNRVHVASSLNVPCSVSPQRKLTVTCHTTTTTDSRVLTSCSSERFHKMHQSPSSHSSPSSQSSLRQSHHPSPRSRHSDQLSPARNVQRQHSGPPSQSSPTQRHSSVSTTQQALQPPEFLRQMMMGNCSPSTTNDDEVPSPNAMSNLTSVSKTDPSSTATNLSSKTISFHQNYPPLFLQTSTPGIPLPVPPPGQPISPVLQPQFFSPTPLTTYPTSLPQPVPHPPFTQNLIMSQPLIMTTSAPAPNIPSFPADATMQPFPVPPPPPHPWFRPQSGQTHFY